MTLVELLVVIGIIGLLIAMLLPAVQAAREAARRAQCKNQLKQLSLSVLLHENAQGFYPTGGWDWSWGGDPDLGAGRGQPGGWFFNILPYFENAPLHDLGRGVPGGQAKDDLYAKRIETIVEGTICPTRRANQLFPNHGPSQNGQLVNTGPYAFSTRIDYAINVGSVEDLECELEENQDRRVKGARFRVCKKGRYNGISYQQSRVRTRQITDGLSRTYCLGEKYLDVAEYDSGIDPGDNESAFSGLNADQFRSTSAHYPLKRDMRGERNKQAFGSSHRSGFHMSFVDGSVRRIGFDIDPDIHERLGSRNDGGVVRVD